MAKMGGMGTGGGTMHEGMTDKSPKFPDKSMEKKGGSVDSGAERSGTAKTPATLGPRTA